MILKELKEWINKLPEIYDEYTVVNGEYGSIDGEYMYRLDKPVITLAVDQETKEILILNDIQNDESEKEEN